MAVEKVVRHLLSMTVEEYVVVHYGLGHAMGWAMVFIFANYGIIGSRDP